MDNDTGVSLMLDPKEAETIATIMLSNDFFRTASLMSERGVAGMVSIAMSSTTLVSHVAPISKRSHFRSGIIRHADDKSQVASTVIEFQV